MTSTELNEAVRNSAMICTFNTKAWSARIKDAKAARAAAEAVGADPRAYRTHKNLMFGHDDRLRAVTAAQQATRNIHLAMTLPWGTTPEDRGIRMLPIELFQDYMRKLGESKKTYNKTLQDFLDNYETDADAAAQGLNLSALERLAFYPKASEIGDRFALRFDFQPIPAGTQFKGLPGSVAETLNDSYEKRMAERMEAALRNAAGRAHEVLEDFSVAVQGRMKSSTWEKVEGLPDMLRSFNLTDDERIKDLADSIDLEILTHYNRDSCRDEKLKPILSDISARLAKSAGVIAPLPEEADG